MLASIEEFSFTVLLMISQLLGVSPLPEEPSPDWEVIQNWKELPDQTYELILKSETIPQYCRENPNHYVVFPQNQVGQYEVWAGNTLTSTNSMSKRWYIKAQFSREVVKCEKLQSSKVIYYKLRSYLKIFAAISRYPTISKGLPVDSILFGPLFLIASGICFSFALVGCLLIWSMNGTGISIYHFLVIQILFGLLMIVYYPGMMFSAPVELLEHSILITLWGGILLFCLEYIYKLEFNINIVLLAILLLSVLAFFSGKNTTQLFITVPIIPVIILIIYKIFKRIKAAINKTDLIDFIIPLLLAVLFGIHDGYAIFISFNRAPLLPVTVILLSWVAFANLVRKIQNNQNELIGAKVKLQESSFYQEKLELLYQSQRQIIHDIKSPLTSLNFILRGKAYSESYVIMKILGRLSSLLSSIENQVLRQGPSWYSYDLLISSIDEIKVEKMLAFKNKIKISMVNKNKKHMSLEVFISPVEIKNIFSELIDNSIKANAREATLNLAIDVETNYIEICYMDNGPGLEEVLIEKGWSKTGSGLGLHGINRKIEEMLGEFSIEYSEKGFVAVIRCKGRSNSNSS